MSKDGAAPMTTRRTRVSTADDAETTVRPIQPPCQRQPGKGLSWSKKTILGIVSVLFVVVAAMFSVRESAAQEPAYAVKSARDGTTQQRIQYVVVEKERDMIRYAAYEGVSKEESSESKEVEDPKPISIQRWAELLSLDGEEASQLRQDFTKKLKDSPYNAFFFETKGASQSSALKKQFEFVLLDAPHLYSFAERNPDPYTFEEHLQCLPKSLPGCAFTSLGGDATLIAPRRQDNEKKDNVVYSHLAAFVRGAPANHVDEYWKMVAQEYLNVLQKRTVWLSTDGTGVAWLHMRLDSVPKYYKYREFANEK